MYWGTVGETWKEPGLLTYYTERLKFGQKLMYINMNKNTSSYQKVERSPILLVQ